MHWLGSAALLLAALSCHITARVTLLNNHGFGHHITPGDNSHAVPFLLGAISPALGKLRLLLPAAVLLSELATCKWGTEGGA